MSLNKFLYSFLAVLIINYSSISFAQTSSETTALELEEIVVTAQRREQNISDVLRQCKPYLEMTLMNLI